MLKSKFVIRTVALAMALALSSSAPWAQPPYPARPIRLVSPFPVGSPFDAVSRKYAEALASRLKTSVIVDSKPGANGALAATEVGRASPDGYTLLITVSDPLIATPATSKVSYDPARDFVPISKIATNAPILLASSKCKGRLDELVADSRIDPNSPCTFYGSFGEGSFPKLVLEAVNRQANAAFRDVAYRGAAPALQDLLGGQIGLAFASASQAVSLAADGRIKPVAIMGAARSPLLASVPTFAEAGYDNFAAQRLSWVGLLGPAKLVPDIVSRLETATRAVVSDPSVSKWLKSQDYEPIGGTSDQFHREIKAEQSAVIDFIRNELKVVPQ
jgi:tripartite-type tricarboxylate transporter receptor subunit TctC